MTALQSLTRKLQNTRLYDTSGGSYLYAELFAFSAGLQLFYDDLAQIEKEMFVLTAENEGLEIYERLMSVQNTDTSLSGRRNSITTALSLCSADYNAAGMNKLPGLFNISGAFTESGQNSLTFTHTGQIDQDILPLIASQMARYTPCGVNFQFV